MSKAKKPVEEATVLVRMSPYLVQALSDGSIGHKWVFGEPDKEGFYEPKIYITTPIPPLPWWRRLLG